MSVRKTVVMEPLESRRLFASAAGGTVVLQGATLKITADPRFGSAVMVTTANEGETINVEIGSKPAMSFSKSSIASIVFNGSNKQDRLTVREDGGRIDASLIVRSRGGSDYIDLDETEARIAAGDGDDTVLGSAGDDRIDGESGRDRLYGGRGFDYIKGGNHGDDIRGDDGDDTLMGERGDDQIDGGFGSDVLKGGDGDNRMVDRARRGEVNIFYGGRDDDDIFGTTTDTFYKVDYYYDRVYLSKPLPRDGGEGNGGGGDDDDEDSDD